MNTIPDDLLRLLAEDAIETQQWAMRQGFKRPQQIERVAKALAKRLTESQAKATEDNAATSAAEGAGRTGVASRPSVGGGTDASNSQIEPDVKADPAQAAVRLDLARAT